VVKLLQRMAENVSYALDNFETEAKRCSAELALRESEARFRSLTELSSDWYWEQDAEFRFTRLEGRHVEGGESVAGESSLGKTRWETGLQVDGEGGWQGHRALLEAHQPFRDVVMYRSTPGVTRHVSISGEPMSDRNGHFIGYRGVGEDITPRKLAEERIQYLAHHDGLTGLPNRVMFSEMLNLAIPHARRYNGSFALLFIDLDRFKIINDTLGHEAGDKLLQEVSARLIDTVRESDVVARLGGDEFVVLVHEVSDAKDAATVAGKILSALIKPVDLEGHECRVTASIGICMYPADAPDEQSLMKNADIAMYYAKEEGKNNFQFYSKDIKSQSIERMALETSLRRAIEREEFFLHYQAKLDLKTGQINGVEALVRWQHPELGLVSPAQFIPLAEETGLIVPLGKWVLRTACAQNMAWQRDGLPPICMAVNLSMRQFADDSLLQVVAAALQDSGMRPELLELELTESMVMHNAERAARMLGLIKQMGVRLAIDDFGVGYSSLAQIKRFPIDTLKVDRSFIRNLPQNPEDRAITEAIIAMGRTLSLTVVAEGVETVEQEAFLREHACDESQGFYFSKPIAADRFADLLRQHVVPTAMAEALE
jgi:diguanylate cyclase (GGDEF)-like protein